MNNGSIAIVTATDRGYLPAACCQLKSTWDNLAKPQTISLHLIVCDVSPDDIDEAKRYFALRNMNVNIIHPLNVIERIQPLSTRWPRAAYLRLYFDSLFPDDIDRLIYFDADTRVKSPLEPLLTVPLFDAPVGAVHDFIYYVTGNIRRRRRDLFLADDAPYLQSGVMVFDWPKTLASRGIAKAREFLAKYPERCHEAPDQDALNAAFEGQWTPLDPRWNLHETYLMFGGTLKPYLEHYTSTKPWSRRRPAAWRDAANWYQDELADTRWNGFIPAQSSADILKAKLTFLKFRYAPKVRDVLAQYAPLLLDAIGKDRERSDNYELPWAPRSRADVEEMAKALINEAARLCPRLLPPEAVLGDRAP